MKPFILTITAIAAFGISGAQAEERKGPPPGSGGEGRPPRPNPEEVFKKIDANADGAISLDEFKSGPRVPKDAAKAEEIYKKIDADGNGAVSLDEFKAHRPPHRGPGGPGGPGGDGEGGRKRGGKGGPGGPGGEGRGPVGPQ